MMKAEDTLGQNEAIYRAGRKAGIGEVVEWVEKHSEMERCDPTVMSYFNDYRWVDDADWLAQKKEWGL